LLRHAAAIDRILRRYLINRGTSQVGFLVEIFVVFFEILLASVDLLDIMIDNMIIIDTRLMSID